MAHELETAANGTASFVSARQDAWHKLGTVLPDTFTAEDAMINGHLGGWNVRKAPLHATVPNGDDEITVNVPGQFATIRTNPFTKEPEALGVVGRYYHPIQNEEHCELLNALVDESGAHFETAGSLRGGREVFVTMKLPKSMRVGGVDDVDTYIAALNSHDGTSPFRLLITPIRIVCANTQAAALSSAKSKFVIRHTSNAKSNIALAREALGLTFTYLDEFQAEAEKMIDSTLREVDFTNKVRRIFKPTDKTDGAKKSNDKLVVQLRQLFTGSETNTEIRGTRWAGYQAVTEYLDHFMPVRNGGDDVDAGRAERTATAQYITDLKANAFKAFAVA
jgi:phage/plasmid-like protein (TIGR03299 family)